MQARQKMLCVKQLIKCTYGESESQTYTLQTQIEQNRNEQRRNYLNGHQVYARTLYNKKKWKIYARAGTMPLVPIINWHSKYALYCSGRDENI